jgi:hypothetical protein
MYPHAEKILHSCTRDCHLYRPCVPPLLMKNQMKRSIDPPLRCCVGRMYVQWREREHEASSELVVVDPNVVAMLMQCGLIIFFLCLFMCVQPRLLNALIDYWHADAEAFMLEGQSLVPTTEDIYFLTGLSRRGNQSISRLFLQGREISRR